MNNLVQFFLAAGLGGTIVAVAIVIFLQPAVKSAIQHSYNKLLENSKTDQVLLQKRFDLAADANSQIASLFEELAGDLQGFTENDEPYLKALLHEFHPIWRSRFRIIRSKYESANDLLSFYSLAFDSLLHPATLQNLFQDECGLTKKSDIKYAYRTTWLVVVECMQSAFRIGSSHEFWNPYETYPERARAWSEVELELIKEYLVGQFTKTGSNDVFSLQIELEKGAQKFWLDMPSES